MTREAHCERTSKPSDDEQPVQTSVGILVSSTRSSSGFVRACEMAKSKERLLDNDDVADSR